MKPLLLSKLVRQIPPETKSLLLMGESPALEQSIRNTYPHLSLTCANSLAAKVLQHVDGVLCVTPDLFARPHDYLNSIHTYLRPGGWLLTCIPNGQHHSVISGLLRGQSPASTFTYASIIRLFLDHSFVPHLLDAETVSPPPGWQRDITPLLKGLGLHLDRAQQYLEIAHWIVRGETLTKPVIPPSKPMTISVCVSDESILAGNLLCSPDLLSSQHQLLAWRNAPHAGSVHNRALEIAEHEWVLCIHQDVYLPPGWMSLFQQRIQEAEERIGPLSVVGVYGVANTPTKAYRCGRVIDRDRVLNEDAPLPREVNSLDELLIAVRKSSQLRFDPELGWHFYGTDICLAAEERKLHCAVVDAMCFHNSQSVDVPPDFWVSKACFEQKWRHRLPLSTSCTADVPHAKS